MVRILLSRPGLFIYLSLMIGTSSNGQLKMGKYEFGMGIAMLVYQGDLTPSAFGSYRTSRFGLNLTGGMNVSPTFMIRGNLLWGRLAGDDAKYSTPAYRQQRNFNFNASVRELSGQLVWRPLKEHKFTPYLFGGVGLSSLRISRDWSGINYDYFDAEASGLAAAIAVDSAYRLPGITPVVVSGFGVKYFITDALALNAEYSYRVMRTDYLDGFRVSANPEMKDHYLSYSIGVSFHTGRKSTQLDCPVIKF
jgi:hypothetical protein